jgi:hypothetical protein
MKWCPGYMSAPHTYATDRLSRVLSGTWWVNSGADFDPDNTVPVPAGGFVRRIARTRTMRTRTMMGSRRTQVSRPSSVFSESHPSNSSWWTRASRAGASSDRAMPFFTRVAQAG